MSLSWLVSVPPQARAGAYTSALKGSVVSTLLDAGLVFLLRFALDDSVEGVMSAAVHALKAFLVYTEDEVRQLWSDFLFCFGFCSFYMCIGFHYIFSDSNILCLCQICPFRSVWTAPFHGLEVWPPSLCYHLPRLVKMRRERGCRKI